MEVYLPQLSMFQARGFLSVEKEPLDELGLNP